jgi:hypothetical protein
MSGKTEKKLRKLIRKDDQKSLDLILQFLSCAPFRYRVRTAWGIIFKKWQGGMPCLTK